MKDQGFTLIEVVAALLIFSVGIVGLISMNTQSVRTINTLEDRFVAGVVADNVLVEARRLDRLEIGEEQGQETSMGREFEWVREISPTDRENLFKIIVQVKEENQEGFLVERIAFRTKAKPQ